MGRDLPALTGIAALRYTYQRAIPLLAKKEQERLTAGSLCVLSTMQGHDAQAARCAAQWHAPVTHRGVAAGSFGSYRCCRGH
jgi:hypothetical protein